MTPATLVVTPRDSRRAYGEPNPAFTAAISGLRNGDQAVFTSVNHDKTFTTPVKIESVSQKYEDTAVVITGADTDTKRIQQIELGGSRTKLEFN